MRMMKICKRLYKKYQFQVNPIPYPISKPINQTLAPKQKSKKQANKIYKNNKIL